MCVDQNPVRGEKKWETTKSAKERAGLNAAAKAVKGGK